MANDKTTKVLVSLTLATNAKDAEMKARAVLMGAQTSVPDTVKGFTVIGVDDSSDIETEFLMGLRL